jgi:hypothetical protein
MQTKKTAVVGVLPPTTHEPATYFRTKKPMRFV